METMEAIRTRRSIRKFKSTPISDRQIWKYLEAANMAPSASNRQPWKFIIIRRKELDEIAGLLDASFQERVKDYSAEEYDDYKKRLDNLPIPGDYVDQVKNMQSFFRHLGKAPVAILVHVDQEDDPWRRFLNIQDAAAATQNLILAAWDDGVGSCWMCAPFIKKEAAIQRFFGIPHQQLIALVPLGYPDINPSPPPKENVHEKIVWFGE